MTKPMRREASLQELRERTQPWDLVVIGGGATGVGVALDASARGLNVALIEQSDFGKGTSSRSTKLIHGGVRYLRQGNIRLVREALAERALLKQNAPHLVRDLDFLIPCRNLWQRWFYGAGLKLYDFLARGDQFGRSLTVSASEALRRIPVLNAERTRSGVIYHDGQFDDTRLLLNMVRSAHDLGGCLINYMTATGFQKDTSGVIEAVEARDQESQETIVVRGRCIINAAGPFCDAVRRLDQPNCEPMVSTSQGIHLVIPRRFFPGETALIVPKTSDGRVMFVIPWHDCALVGTTDTPVKFAELEPKADEDEVDFLLKTVSDYLQETPSRDDVLSVFAGLRPLVKHRSRRHRHTAKLARDHVIDIHPSGLINITGGKWTTVRKMAEDCVDQATAAIGIMASPSPTKSLAIHGSGAKQHHEVARDHYGTDLDHLVELEQRCPELKEPLSPYLPQRRSEVVWGVRHEMARTVEDVLARRTRMLLLNARAAIQAAPEVARLMAQELQQDDAWCDQQVDVFKAVAERYIVSP